MSDSMGLVFAKGIDMYSVNPDNNALKNQYVDNILCTSLAVFSKLVSVAKHIEDMKVTKGFISRSKLYSSVDKPSARDVKHAKGLGLSVTWKGYEPEEALSISKKFFEESTNDFEIIIEDNQISFYRGVQYRKVLRLLNDGSKSVIYKSK